MGRSSSGVGHVCTVQGRESRDGLREEIGCYVVVEETSENGRRMLESTVGTGYSVSWVFVCCSSVQ